MIQHLVGDAVFAACRHQIFHITDIEVTDAPVADHTFLYQFVHARNCLGQRHFAAPVEKIQIQIVSAKPLQRLFAALKDVLSSRIPWIYLRNKIQFRAIISPDCFANQLLRLSFSIHLGRIDQCHSMLDAIAQGSKLLLMFHRIFAHFPGPLPKGRYYRSIFQSYCLHAFIIAEAEVKSVTLT